MALSVSSRLVFGRHLLAKSAVGKMSTASASVKKRQTPRRAMMYVPGNDERKQAKIPNIGADCICLDCEDGVALAKKEAARKRIRHILDERPIDFGRSECSVRVNPLESGLGEEDIRTIFGGPNLPDAVHLPKVESPGQLSEFARVYRETVSATRRGDAALPPVGLIIFIESGRGLMRLPEIFSAAHDLSNSTNLSAEAVVFGSDDYVADVGATRTPEATELLYARQKIVSVAKAFQLQAIDLVHIDFKNLDDLRRQSEEGMRMGFTGKQVIHPGQVPVVQAAFSPSPEKVEWATQLIAEFRQHERTGKGAFNFRGSMIDMPLVKQAQSIVDMMESS